MRRYRREVTARNAAGNLDRSAFGTGTVPRREPIVEDPRRFVAITMAVQPLAYLIHLPLG